MNDTVDLFLAVAGVHAQRPAVRCGALSVSYAQLEGRVRRIAGRVSERGDARALIALPQGPDAYAAMLGVAMGGGYYAPVNLSSPPEKIRRIVRSFAPGLVFAPPEIAPAILADAPDAELINLDNVYDLAPLNGRGLRHQLAYVIFTSGSTGQPKGVVIPRSALDHYVGWVVKELGLEPDDIVSQHPNIAFDLSVMDTFGALCSGAALCPLTSQGDRLMPARAIARERITVWISVPSVVGLMSRAGQANADNLATVRLLVFCGEPLLVEHLQTIFSARPSAKVVNTYGPTETAVSVTSLPLTALSYDAYCSRTVAIGQPISDMEIHLLGGANSDEGEIVIVGPQLASEYWRDPEQTERNFRTVTIEGRTLRAYFTGDWAQRVHGQIYFQNRIDFQVKIRGLRLELDEVAAAIRALGWTDVCVMMQRGEIVAVIEAADNALDEARLRQGLAEKLETHAIPVRIIRVPALPRNENDKIDRLALERRLNARD